MQAMIKNEENAADTNDILYLSKGLFRQAFDDGSIIVESRGEEHRLDAEMARMWLAGKGKPASAVNGENLRMLESKNLIEMTPCEDRILDTYRLLTQCMIAHKEGLLPFTTSKSVRRTLRWIYKAGFHLTMAELVQLEKLDLMPEAEYLGEENRQALVEAIYCAGNIEDGVLEALMEKAEEMPITVKHVLILLQEGHIFLM